MRILAIDPGPVESAAVVYDLREGPLTWWKCANSEMLTHLDSDASHHIAIEMIASYGMAVGAEVFATCLWVGRFYERWQNGGGTYRLEPLLVFRREVKMHLCQSPRAKDANIRAALIDRYGPGKEKAVGLKASPGPLYGMAGDCWAALGVAVTAAETRVHSIPMEAV